MTGETIRVALAPRLVTELPRFFGGRRAAFIELFQNAYRAGAQSVEAHLEGNVLTFHDDGAGCPDPQLLLSAGATGWDESRVVEPAGLGFFSLMAKDVSVSIEAESFGWRVRLVPDHVLAEKPVHIERGGGFNQRGMRLRLVLVDANIDYDFKLARGYYPFRVTLNGQEVPPADWTHDHHLSTPVGEIGLRSRARSPCSHAIWEHRLVEGSALREALAAAADSPITKGILDTFHIDWKVDPRSGVTPKLPDRNDLAQSPALVAAARTILRTIQDHFLGEAKQLSRTWPATLEPSWETRGWLMDSRMGTAILAHLGWMQATCERWDETGFYYIEDDGWQIHGEHVTRYTKAYIEVQEPHVAQSINNAILLGAKLPYARVSRRGLQVEVRGHRRAKGEGWVDLAREIRVGEHVLPFLLDDREDRAKVVLACNADVATCAVMGKEVQLPGGIRGIIDETLTCYLAANDDTGLSEDGWGDYEDGGSLDTGKVRRDLVEQISDDFVGGERAKARHELHKLGERRRDLAALRREAESLLKSLKGIPVGALVAAAKTAEAKLDARIKRVAARAKLPA